jgi:hypothetical protein
MFDPGGVLHAALRAALRRSHECFARGGSLDELGMISPPPTPRVYPRSRAEGDLGGRKEKAIHKLLNLSI